MIHKFLIESVNARVGMLYRHYKLENRVLVFGKTFGCGKFHKRGDRGDPTEKVNWLHPLSHSVKKAL